MKILQFIFRSLVSPIYNRLMAVIAYGPWGALHRVLIFVFKKLYSIEYTEAPHFPFRTLGDFFLRSIPLAAGQSKFRSPAEGSCIDGPARIEPSGNISIKNIRYAWPDIKEFDVNKFSQGTYWNIYLAPHNYHWVHSPCSGTQLEAIRVPGALFPVNGLGRWICPMLYSENERVTFRLQTKEFGEVIVLCVGAMGVSGLFCEKGAVYDNQWTHLQAHVEQGERLLAFRLGSTVVVLTEKTPTSLLTKSVVKAGDDLIGL